MSGPARRDRRHGDDQLPARRRRKPDSQDGRGWQRDRLCRQLPGPDKRGGLAEFDGTLTNTIDYSYYGDALLETATDTYQNTTGTNYSTTTADNSQYSFAYNALGWLTTVNNNGR